MSDENDWVKLVFGVSTKALIEQIKKYPKLAAAIRAELDAGREALEWDMKILQDGCVPYLHAKAGEREYVIRQSFDRKTWKVHYHPPTFSDEDSKELHTDTLPDCIAKAEEHEAGLKKKSKSSDVSKCSKCGVEFEFGKGASIGHDYVCCPKCTGSDDRSGWVVQERLK